MNFISKALKTVSLQKEMLVFPEYTEIFASILCGVVNEKFFMCTAVECIYMRFYPLLPQSRSSEVGGPLFMWQLLCGYQMHTTLLYLIIAFQI